MKNLHIKYTTAVIFLIVIGFTGVYIHKTAKVEIGADKFKEVKEIKIGEKYIHRFDDNGTIIEIETTKEEYKALGLKGAGQPTYGDAKWIGSGGGISVMEMPKLKDNEYYIINNATGTEEIIVKLPNEKEKIIKLKDL